MMEMTDVERRTGWLAKLSAPMPMTVVSTEKKIAVLWLVSIGRPLLYSRWSPSMMKMLKSSPMPNMKVERMMFTMLKSIFRTAIRPRMTVKAMNIGAKVISVSSSRR